MQYVVFKDKEPLHVSEWNDVITSRDNPRYPCHDSSNPICKDFVKGRCKRKHNCKFYHPLRIDRISLLQAGRKSGECFCGAPLIKVVKKRYNTGEDRELPLFFCLCSRTKRSIKRCMNV